jgi:hypothetical protein
MVATALLHHGIERSEQITWLPKYFSCVLTMLPNGNWCICWGSLDIMLSNKAIQFRFNLVELSHGKS